MLCIADSTVPIEIRKYRKGYRVKKASWQDLFLGHSIVTAQDEINMIDPGDQK